VGSGRGISGSEPSHVGNALPMAERSCGGPPAHAACAPHAAPAGGAAHRGRMSPMLRMRQICLVAEALEPAVEELCTVLGIEVCHRDAAVERYGLENALMPIGNQLLEVVAPIREGTAGGRYLERRGGNGGYMVILQTDDPAPHRERLSKLGVRIVSEPTYDDYAGMQLHPRDTGGAILSVDWNDGDPEDAAGPWHPAGPDWQRARRTDRVT